MRIIPVILAGGAGERLWPLSRADYPKQFALKDDSGNSLFQAAVMRVAAPGPFAPPVIVCHHAHRFLVREQLRQIGCEDAVMILEPEARNTAPAITLAAAHIAAHDPQALMLVLPSDHRIEMPERLCRVVTAGVASAQAGLVCTFGIVPGSPETAYGYIEAGELLKAAEAGRAVLSFVEKPDRATAAQYVQAGNYYWNSGMFLMRADAALAAVKRHAPAIHAACKEAYAKRVVDGDFIRPNAAILKSCPAISFDYAVMEHLAESVVLPLDAGWSDLGSWTALDAVSPKDRHRNAIVGDAVLVETEGCFIHSSKPLVGVIGMADMVVVATEDSVLVGPKERMQEVKQLLARMRAVGLPQTQQGSTVHKPWGQFHAIDRGVNYQVKKLVIKPGGKISLQRHRHRAEHWVVVKGTALVARAGEQALLGENQSIHIEAGQEHRLENPGADDLIVIEVQTGSYLAEDDIERLEDIYQRCEVG